MARPSAAPDGGREASIARAVADAERPGRPRRGISRALAVRVHHPRLAPPGATAALATVTSASHVFSRTCRGCAGDPSSYFTADVARRGGLHRQAARRGHLRALAADADHLVLWLTATRGENIAHEVIGITRRALELSAARRSESGDAAAAARRSGSRASAKRGGRQTGAGAEGKGDEGAGQVGEEGVGRTQMRRVHRATFSATPDALSAAFELLDASCQMLCSLVPWRRGRS